MDQLVALIRRDKKVLLGEACRLLDVGPWQVERYRKAILQICPDVRWNDSDASFETIILSPSKLEVDVKQRSVEDYVRRVQGPEKA
jgi:hypothetical protein